MLKKQDKENFTQLDWLDEFMIGHGGFICGGCFKNIFNKEKIKDIDMFFKTRSDFEEAIKYFDSMTVEYDGIDKREKLYTFYYENDNVKAYRHNRTGVVLELCCKIFGTAEQIISQFDFTITKFAYYKAEIEDESGVEVEVTDPTAKTHIEYRVVYDDKFFEHLHIKRLVTDDKIPYPMSTFERMLRYAKYGYFPCRETKMKIIQALRGLSDREIELPKNFYDGMD